MVLLLALNLFLVFVAYYIIKPVREGLILAAGGAEVKSYTSAGQSIFLLFAVPLYGVLAGKFSRRKLVNVVTIFFIACLLGFYFLAQTQLTPFVAALTFYIWVGVFNLMVPTQVWSIANDVYNKESGKRLFAIVAFGASSGAVFGSFISGRIIEPLGVYQMLLVSAAILVVSLVISNWIDSLDRPTAQASQLQDNREESIGSSKSFRLVFNNKYLLMIGMLMLLMNLVNTTGEYILGKTVLAEAKRAIEMGATADLGAFIGKFYADFFGVVNVVSLLTQLFLVSRILKYGGTGIALLVLPCIALMGYTVLAFVPVLAIVRWVKIAENSTDYSLNNTVRNVLFLPLNREEKFAAKQATDTFFFRAGDLLSAGLVLLGTSVLAFSPRHFAAVNLGLVLIWIVLAIAISRRNKQLTS